MSNMIEIENWGKVSEETIAEALEEKFGKPKKKFKPIDIHFGCFTVSVNSENDIMVANGPSYSSCAGCIQSPLVTRKFIAALQSAIGFVEKNK